MAKLQKSWKYWLLFPLCLWLFSRLVICIVMVDFAPLLPAPPGGIVATGGWDVFAAWDSDFYERIAIFGYNTPHSVAFFPLYPLLVRGVMALGLPFVVAGTIVNNLAFLAALIFIYNWVASSHSKSVARWTIVVLAWFPLSIFGTVIYSEGLYLLLSSVALRAFEQKRYWWVVLTGSLATATRPTAIALIPTFLIVCWREGRKVKAYIASLATGLGVFFYSLYCQIYFQDALAFIHVQKAWQPAQDFLGQDWLKMVMQVAVGTRNWQRGTIVDVWHPLIFVVICVSGCSLWKSSFKLRGYSLCFLGFVLWLVAGNPLLNSAITFGGIYLLWYCRSLLSNTLVTYGICSYALILSTGRTTSIERYVYAIVSVAVSLGILLSRYPRYGYIVSAFFAFLLILYSLRFAQHLWVA
ncbi:mannosyltransferase family protein [Synechocystis sp. PCC 7509]|uniref:mannosyltransferase family protein n=1 Tax=Synechocystis sp. PCC 7509 TaxID=927677 RepID=UPI0002AD0EAB|nr:mannosyltransferase family protein [Synechocystis sp. PCC 7509]